MDKDTADITLVPVKSLEKNLDSSGYSNLSGQDNKDYSKEITGREAEKILLLIQDIYGIPNNKKTAEDLINMISGDKTTMGFVYNAAKEMGLQEDLVDNLSKIVLSDQDRDKIMEKYKMSFSRQVKAKFFSEKMKLLLPQNKYEIAISEDYSYRFLVYSRLNKNKTQKRLFRKEKEIKERVAYFDFESDKISGTIGDELILKIFDAVIENIPYTLRNHFGEIKINYTGEI